MTTRLSQLTEIAREHLGIETLDARKISALDYPEAAAVRQALEAAYSAGQSDLLAAALALLNARDKRMETKSEWQRLRRAVRKARGWVGVDKYRMGGESADNRMGDRIRGE